MTCKAGGPEFFDFKKAFSSARGKFYVARIIRNKETYNKLVETLGRRGTLDENRYFPEYRDPD